MRKAMNHDDYLIRAREFALRGSALPQTRLTPSAVNEIREAREKREDLRLHIKEKLSNDALAAKFGVHVRTIEKAIKYETFRQVKREVRDA